MTPFTKMLKALASLSQVIFIRQPETHVDATLTTTNDQEGPELAAIENIPAEIGLLILEKMPDLCALRNIVKASPFMHAVYIKNRQRLLTRVLAKTLDCSCSGIGTILLQMDKFEENEVTSKAEESQRIWMSADLQEMKDDCAAGRTFADTKPDISDLVIFCKTHWQILERLKVVEQRLTEMRLAARGQQVWHVKHFADHVFCCLYLLEILARLIGKRPQGSLSMGIIWLFVPPSADITWSDELVMMMADVARIIWPSTSKAPDCRKTARRAIINEARWRKLLKRD